MTDHVQQQLPAAFSDLEGWIDWSLPTQKQRYAKRAQSTLSDLRAFSSALTPRMHDLIQHLDSFAWGSTLNPTDERLYHLGLAYWEATIPLDLKWKSPIAQDSFPVERLTIPDAY